MNINLLFWLSFVPLAVVLKAQESPMDQQDFHSPFSSLATRTTRVNRNRHQAPGVLEPKGKPMRRPAAAVTKTPLFLFSQCIDPVGRFHNLGQSTQYQDCIDGEINDMSAERDTRRHLNTGILIIK